MSFRVVKSMRQLRVPEPLRLVSEQDTAPTPAVMEQALANILHQAEAEARTIVEQAKREAQKVAREARQAGFEEGREAAWQELSTQFHTEWDPVAEQLRAISARARELADFQRMQADEEVVALAAVLAERLLGSVLVEHPEWLEDHLAGALALLPNESLRLSVGTGFADSVESLAERMVSTMGSVDAVVDAAMPRFEVRLNSAGVTMLAGIESGIGQLVDTIRYGDEHA